jgi:hypothetical protein
MSLCRPLIVAALVGLSAPAVAGDVLLIDAVARNQQAAEHSVPAPGLSMQQVEQRYGAPAQMLAPVGDPPITRWVYDDFIVYFEYDRVIHSVVRRGAH